MHDKNFPRQLYFFQKQTYRKTPLPLPWHTVCLDFKLVLLAWSHCWHHIKYKNRVYGRQGWGEGRNLVRKDITHWKTKLLMQDLGKKKKKNL